MQFIEINTTEELNKHLSDLPSTIALDVETDGLKVRECKLKAIVLATETTGYSISANLLEHLSFITKHTLILQNFKFDFAVLYNHGLNLYETKFRDIMLMHHLIDENAPHNLNHQIKYSFNDAYKELFWKKYKDYVDAPRDEQLEYECKDGIYTLRLFSKYNKVLADMQPLVEHIHEFARELSRTELEGVCLDTDHILEVMPKLHTEITEIGSQLRPSVEDLCIDWELQTWKIELDKRKTVKGKQGVKQPTFNFQSATQVKWLLYDALKLPIQDKTKKGAPATDYKALEKLEGKHPVVGLLKNYKRKNTLYNTFVKGILERQEDGFIYPEFNINGTTTGRISSSNPNLQNMPKEGPYRGFFIPSPGQVFFGADYAQLEIVIEANLSGDRNLRKIVLEGTSKHDITNDELKLGDRQLAKTLNFAMQYHCSTHKVKQLLKCSEKEAEYLYNKYWEVYKGVKQLKSFTDKKVELGEPIVSPFGRNRHFPTNFATKGEVNRARRQAYNALIQGTGADITHKAFTDSARWIRATGYGRMLWPIHDEILGECTKATADLCMKKLVTNMEDLTQHLQFELPLKAVGYTALDRWAKT